MKQTTFAEIMPETLFYQDADKLFGMFRKVKHSEKTHMNYFHQLHKFPIPDRTHICDLCFPGYDYKTLPTDKKFTADYTWNAINITREHDIFSVHFCPDSIIFIEE